MSTHAFNKRTGDRGSSLVLVLMVTAAGILVVSGMLTWISSNNHLTERQNRYQSSVAAAGAATEKVIAFMGRDFRTGGDAAVMNNLDTYRGLVPSKDDGLLSGLVGVVGGLLWKDYQFTDALGNSARTYVSPASTWTYTNISSRFPGLKGYRATYRLVSNARNTASRYDNLSAVKHEVTLASIPVFHYQVFYTPDLEVNPSGPMTLRGRVHCNGSLYSQPSAQVTFNGPVTAARQILHEKHPLDPSARGLAPVLFQGGHESGVNTLTLPLGTNTSLSAFRSIIEIPPALESTNSTLGKQRLYNKADLIILVSNGTAVAKSGAYNNFAVTIPWTNIAETVVITGGKGKGGGKSKGKGKGLQGGVTNVYDGVVSTNVTFFNHRENKTVQCTEIDIVEFLAKFSYLQSLLGRPVRTLYVADMRTQTASTQSGLRVVYGETLPAGGLTIVTPNPLYLEGDYNVPAAFVGTTNTSGSVPAALIADAITLLSDWYDANSTLTLSARVATNTTINAALIAGIVPSGGGYYSGGVENLVRLLENWSGKTLTINGSLVCLYHSKIATAPWGARPDVYTPPVRNWHFDPKLADQAGLPRNTPEVRTIIRRGWEMTQANRVN